MGEIDKLDSPVLVEAVIVWTGCGQHWMPRRDESFLVSRFGAEMASELLSVVKSLEDEFYASEARFATGSLAEIGRMAADDFRKKHPGVATQIVEALEWCFTFDMK